MAELQPRAGRPGPRRRSARALMLAGAMIAIVFSGLFLARSASAAPAAQAASAAQAAPPPRRPAAQAASAETGGHAAATSTSEIAGHAAGTQLTTVFTPTQFSAGVCNVPGIGDIGGLVGLCQAGSGVVGDLNNICTSNAPSPELATSGINSLITTPGGTATNGKTLYDNYNMAGQFWASTGLTCSQMTSQIGNNVAGMVFDMAKSLDRVTITVYQSAASRQHPVLAQQLGRPADRGARQRCLLPVPGAGGAYRRDLAGLDRPGPQAGHPDPRGHRLDGHRRGRRDLADRTAGRFH